MVIAPHTSNTDAPACNPALMDRDRFSVDTAGLRAMHSYALTQRSLARRQRDARRVRLCHSLIRKCLRALRYAARMEAGCVPADATGPTGPTTVFSETPENVFQTPAPLVQPVSNRRRTFRERLRRR
ncbi:MAG: hypothetical protein REJ23_03430 [Brevundimonas sp.]|nr:hypothetical protein [Brevundimonas sp.]